MSTSENDIKRLKQEYAVRKNQQATIKKYSPLDSSYLFMLQQRQRTVAKLLQQIGVETLPQGKILEIGCGHGDVLHELLFHRIRSDNLYGIDLLPDRIIQAKSRFPNLNLSTADAQKLPFSSNQFDLVVQFTVFSSILDEIIKVKIAAEMLRVIKPDGWILWYDFWLNPTNAQTKGIRKIEIRKLFPSCELRFKRLTLAPPIARRLVPVSWTLSALLEKLALFNTHYLVAIRPPQDIL
jgi:ubiquinone/menaquinone biosynthesis C-methylase UbiE